MSPTVAEMFACDQRRQDLLAAVARDRRAALAVSSDHSSHLAMHFGAAPRAARAFIVALFAVHRVRPNATAPALGLDAASAGWSMSSGGSLG